MSVGEQAESGVVYTPDFTYSDLLDEPDYSPDQERGQRFGSPDAVAEWAFDLGIEDYTDIIDMEDGSYAPRVNY
jgi:hypothetical protein